MGGDFELFSFVTSDMLLTNPSGLYVLLVNSLLKLFSAECGGICLFRTNPDEVFYGGLHQYVNMDFNPYLNSVSPYSPCNMKIDNKELIIQRSLDKGRDKVGPDSYYEYLLNKDYYHTLFAYVRISKNNLVLLSVIRKNSQPEFNSHEINRLEKLLPHVAELTRISVEANKTRVAYNLLLQSEAKNGLILVNDRHEVMDYNERAHSLIRELEPNQNIREFIKGLSTKLPLIHGYKMKLHATANASAKERYEISVRNDPECETMYLLVVISENKSLLDGMPILSKFTLTEKKVAELVVRGCTNREISNALFISENTVKVHLRNIYSKAEVNSRAMLINKLLSLGSIKSVRDASIRLRQTR